MKRVVFQRIPQNSTQDPQSSTENPPIDPAEHLHLHKGFGVTTPSFIGSFRHSSSQEMPWAPIGQVRANAVAERHVAVTRDVFDAGRRSVVRPEDGAV